MNIGKESWRMSEFQLCSCLVILLFPEILRWAFFFSIELSVHCSDISKYSTGKSIFWVNGQKEQNILKKEGRITEHTQPYKLTQMCLCVSKQMNRCFVVALQGKYWPPCRQQFSHIVTKKTSTQEIHHLQKLVNEWMFGKLGHFCFKLLCCSYLMKLITEGENICLLSLGYRPHNEQSSHCLPMK